MRVSNPRKKSIISPRLKAWVKKYRLSVALIAGAAISAIIFIAVLLPSVPQVDYNATYSIEPAPQKTYSPLTGVELPEGTNLSPPVTAVMIENSTDSRPQSGLKEAGIVYEAVSEGGVTRFLALYQHEKPELIGPVRSLRMHYMDWAAPYQASVAHVGGSHNALETVRSGAYRDIDQFFNAGAYWRASDRYAPHNVYTNSERLAQLNADKGHDSSTFEGFARTDGEPAEQPNATSIAINFSSALYGTTYQYDAQSNTYSRSLAGAPHNDRERGQITPSVVVALRTKAQSRGGPDGYEDRVTSGSGQAYIFQNGTVSEVVWKKTDRNSPLQLIGADDEPLSLVRGQTWIGAITERGSVSWQ